MYTYARNKLLNDVKHAKHLKETRKHGNKKQSRIRRNTLMRMVLSCRSFTPVPPWEDCSTPTRKLQYHRGGTGVFLLRYYKRYWLI